MKIAIAQPTYLPWLGYFDLMDQVDTFVILDTVQFEKQSWQQRNRIKTPTGLQWLTVPVVFRGRLTQKINEVEIREADFWRNHLRAIELNYARAPFFRTYFDPLSEILTNTGQNLVQLNVRIIEWITGLLRISTNLVLASTLCQMGKRTELLANICLTLGGSDYLSPLGSAEYLLPELEIMSNVNIRTSFHHYEHPCYKQQFAPFCPFAAVIDLLFNEGDRAMEIIRSGRREPFAPQQVANMAQREPA